MKKIKCIFDPLSELMSYYGEVTKGEKNNEADENKTLEEILKERIIDGNKIGIEEILDKGLKKYSALEIINDILLDGMKTVGELFGSGQMQLPFVLQSAECMKACVNYLEPFMEKLETQSHKGSMILATVKGDVHDIGKNLVDIILTNNGYKVINLGIKIPLDRIIEAYNSYNADTIGMSGLLVKSTAIMKENLEIMNERNIEVPVILGGAALNRRFVEGELREMYKGDVYYANDAFDGLKFMNSIMQHKKAGTRPELKMYKDNRDDKKKETNAESINENIVYSNIDRNNIIPTPPFYGSKIVENIPLEKAFEFINETALFKGSWNVYKDRNKDDEDYERLIKEKIYPKYNELKLKSKRENLLNPKVIYGYYPCQSEKNDLIIYKPKELDEIELYKEWKLEQKFSSHNTEEWIKFSFPRQSGGKHFCISDFYRNKESGVFDVVALMIVTMGSKATEYAQSLYNNNQYQEYLYFHGLSVESTEGLAEYWHYIIRKELEIDKKDSQDLKKIFQQGYQGSRYSFGYAACPDLEDNKKLFEILKPERIGILLSEEWQMVPEQSTNAIITHHPDAKYFFVK